MRGPGERRTGCHPPPADNRQPQAQAWPISAPAYPQQAMHQALSALRAGGGDGPIK
jgi:hypothetical protein